MTDEPREQPAFDFDAHERGAINTYQKQRPTYEAFAAIVHAVLRDSLRAADLNVASIEYRAKSVESFGRKAAQASLTDAEQPRYPQPMVDITDLAGLRIITFFPRTVHEADTVLRQQFRILEVTNKADCLTEEERLGYQSVHYLVSLNDQRVALPEYSRFAGLIAEVQVRTILQHAWAEIEHDIQYKSVETIPSSVRRRFMALAGMLEIADREFQAVQDEDQRLRQQARASISQGRLASVEITGDALKAYLDKKLGVDRRMVPDSYDWLARALRRLGFVSFDQIDECIAPYDDDTLSRKLWGSRLGQISRFELQLLAGMGDRFLERHPWCQNGGWGLDYFGRRLNTLKGRGVAIGAYDPAGTRSAEAGA